MVTPKAQTSRAADTNDDRKDENALLDQQMFMLSPEQLQSLHDAMDAPPKPSDELRALLIRKPRWTQERR